MKSSTICQLTVAALLASMSCLAHAADPSSAFMACADEPDDTRRLHCFDAAVAGLRGSQPAHSGVAASTPTPPAPAKDATSEDRFGARGDLRPDKHKELSEIEATVDAIAARPRGERVVTLDNGQVWAEISPGSKVKLAVGDQVKIEAGLLGSFFMVVNGRSSKVSRVR